MSARIGRVGGLGLLLMATALTAHAATYTVTTTADKGAGSLREAIEKSNQTVGTRDFIRFNIAGIGPHTIMLQSALPAITDAVLIDGYTQLGASFNTEAGGNNAVLQIVLDGSRAGLGAKGLSITAPKTKVKGLVIHSFTGDGIFLGGSGGNIISGNFIGTDPMGQTAKGNRLAGISIRPGSSGNVVGGERPEDRNVISGNGSGISINRADGTVVEGNFIGTNKTGNAKLGNGNGIGIVRAQTTRIGGTTLGQRNVISGNIQAGIYSENGSKQRILGNFIGTDVAGTGELGNGSAGVDLSGNANWGEQGTVVGRTTTGAGNLIAYNAEEGVVVRGSPSMGNTIRGNSIFKNKGIGIDLERNGVTKNDAAPDADSGANRLQNFPMLTAVKASGAGLKVSGFLHSEPSTTFYIDFYTNEVRDPSGHGEGQFYLGTIEVTTNAQGQFDFVANLPASSGVWISATATRKETIADTSEFSPFVARQGREFGVNNTNSSGPGSLAQAMQNSNANGKPDEVNRIVFHIPGDGPHHILFAPMDIYDHPLTIDGSSQPGARRKSASNRFTGEVNIVLEGRITTGVLLAVAADNVTLRGLSIINTQPANQAAALLSFGNDLWITGSLIGLQPDGTAAPHGFGISVLGEDSSIGGPGLADRNVISAHPLGGMTVVGSRSVVQNNLIGTDVRGTGNRGNGAWGVSTAGNGTDITITKNTIAFNASGGVQLLAPHTVVSQNRIFTNGGLGIDRTPAGVNPNVPQGAQNHPVLESATVGTTGTTVIGTLNSTPKTTFHVEFFKSPGCDPSGFGEGKIFLGKRLVKTGVAGKAAFQTTLSVPVTVGQAITATATDPSGKTSEFSPCMTAQ